MQVEDRSIIELNILNYINDQNNIGVNPITEEISEHFNLSVSDVEEILNGLKEKGFIDQESDNAPSNDNTYH